MIKKSILILFAVIGIVMPYSLSAQPIGISIEDQLSCPGRISVPILVENFNDVASISLKLNYDTNSMIFDTIDSPHPDVASGFWLTNAIDGSVLISWFELTAVDIGRDTLAVIHFNFKAGDVTLHWDTASSGCMLTDATGAAHAAVYDDAYITSRISPPNLLYPLNWTSFHPTSLVLEWSSSDCDPIYEIWVAYDNSFNDIFIKKGGITKSYYLLEDMKDDTTYYWRTAIVKSGIDTLWSGMGVFSTGNVLSAHNIENQNVLYDINVFPNPVQSHSRLEFGSLSHGTATIRVFSEDGREIYHTVKKKVHAGNNIFEIRNELLGRGIYLLVLEFSGSDEMYVIKTSRLVSEGK